MIAKARHPNSTGGNSESFREQAEVTERQTEKLRVDRMALPLVESFFSF